MPQETGYFFQKASACPVCGSGELRFVLTIDYWREFPMPFDRCGGCGATFANPMPASPLIARGNNALVRWYEQHRTLEDEFRDARQAYLRGKILGRRLKRWKPQGTLLELGCYTGFLLLGAQDASGWRGEGLEISDDLARVIEGALGLKCHNGTLEELRLPENQYDFVLCHDLIEHINQPERFLGEVARVLKPGGRIQIKTPNANQDLAYSKRCFDAGYPVGMLLNHILMFSPQALRVALERSGFRILKLHTYDVRYALKDFGVFGLNPPRPGAEIPLMEEALKLPKRDLISHWNAQRVEDLRHHPKTSDFYGFVRETLPWALTWKVPPQLGVGHEIFAVAEKI